MPSEWSLEEALLSGNDEILEINSDLRTINVPSGYVFGVFNDKDVFPVLFKMDRTYDGQDMSEFQFRINYQNANGEGGNYIVEDKKVETKTIYFSWLLGREVFRGEGQVKFVVCLRKFNTDGSIAKEFNTTIARGTVLSGLEVDDPESDPYKIIGQVDSLEILAQVEDIQKDVDEKAVDVTDRYNDVMQVKRTFGSPLVAATAAAMTDATRVYVYTGSESGYTNGHWYYYQDSKWNDGGVYNSSAINTDATLKVSGMAADAKAAGDAIDDLKADLDENVNDLKSALTGPLLALLRKVAYIDDQGQSYYDALYAALYAGAYPRIVATYTPGSHVVYTDDSLDSLKTYMTVTYYETVQSAGTTVAANDYTLTGTLVEGENTIVVGYDDLVTTVQVEAVDFYNVMHWNSATNPEIVFSTGLFDTSQYHSDKNNTVELKPYSTNYPRICMCANRGVCPFLDTNEVETEYYPIPIPVNATTIRITWPDTVYKLSVQQKKYVGQYIFGWVADSGWQTGGSYETNIVTSQTKGKADCLYINVQKGNNQPIAGDTPTIDIQFT